MSGLSVSIAPQNPGSAPVVASTSTRAATVPGPHGSWRCGHATIRSTMPLDDRFDDLIASLGGFHRSWLIYLGIELGLFAHVRESRRGRADGGRARGARRLPAGGDRRVGLGGRRARPGDARGRPADDRRRRRRRSCSTTDRPEYLGGQFVHAAVASLDWGGMVDFFRTGEPIRERPDRYRVAIERLTAQDIAVFFQEALAALPAAGRRPGPRRAGRGRPLRRRPMAHRDGAPVPGAWSSSAWSSRPIRSSVRGPRSPRPG